MMRYVNLERATELVENDATVIGHLADVYYARHDYRKALPLYRKVLKLDPERKDVAEKIRKIKARRPEKNEEKGGSPPFCCC